MCDRVAIMNKGKIVALDTPDALKGMAKKGEVADIVVKNMSEAQVNSLRGLDGVSGLASEVQDSVLGQTRLRVRLENVDALPMVLDFFFREKIKLVNFRQEEPTLEDAFIELTGTGVGHDVDAGTGQNLLLHETRHHLVLNLQNKHFAQRC